MQIYLWILKVVLDSTREKQTVHQEHSNKTISIYTAFLRKGIASRGVHSPIKHLIKKSRLLKKFCAFQLSAWEKRPQGP